jgi:hypothetical protein
MAEAGGLKANNAFDQLWVEVTTKASYETFDQQANFCFYVGKRYGGHGGRLTLR